MKIKYSILSRQRNDFLKRPEVIRDLTYCLTESSLLSTYLFNRNEGKEIGASQARQARVQGRVDWSQIRAGRSTAGRGSGQTGRPGQVRMDSERLAWRGPIWQHLGCRLEPEGIKPSVRRVTVRYRRQTGPMLTCACGPRDFLPKESSRCPFSFVGDVLRRHTPPSANRIESKNRHSPVKAFLRKVRLAALGHDGQLDFAELRLSHLRLGNATSQRKKSRGCCHKRTKSALISPNRTKLTGAAGSARLLGSAFPGRFHGLIGDSNHILKDGMHSQVRVGRSGSGGLFHAGTLPSRRQIGSAAVKVAHYRTAGILATSPAAAATAITDEQPRVVHWHVLPHGQRRHGGFFLLPGDFQSSESQCEGWLTVPMPHRSLASEHVRRSMSERNDDEGDGDLQATPAAAVGRSAGAAARLRPTAGVGERVRCQHDRLAWSW